VKIRGFRIELGEIAATLANIDGVKQAVVIDRIRAEGEGGKYLAAYLVSEDEQVKAKLTDSFFVEQLKAQLPEYMVPSSFMLIDDIPTTINGKLDRRALPEPTFDNADGYVAPTTELETLLCDVWQQVLKTDRVGTEDNFFRIGGDSIISIQLVSKLRQAGYQLQVKAIFDAPTVAQLAKLIESGAEQEAFDIEQGQLTGQFDLLPVQQWFFEQQFAQPNHWNQAFMVQLPANISTAQVTTAVAALAQRHDVLRSRFVATEHDWKQEYTEAATANELISLSVANLSDDELFDKLTACQAGFDVENGTLWQAVHLTDYPDKRSRLFFGLHHLVVDAVSWRIIAEDVKLLLSDVSGDTLNELPPKTSSYRQWSNAIQSYAEKAAKSSAEMQFWQGVIADQRELSGMATEQANEQLLSFTPELTKQLLQDANGGYHTEINDLLLASLAQALASVLGHDVNHITLEGHGRESLDGVVESKLDISQTVGWFTTMYPVRLAAQSSVEQTIIQTKEALRAMPMKGLGYGALKQADKLAGSLPRVSFNYLGQFGGQVGDSSQEPSQEASHTSNTPDWQLITEHLGTQVPQVNQGHLVVNINAGVRDGQLQIHIASKLTANQNDQLVSQLQQSVEAVVKQAVEMAQQGGKKTPSDYGVAKLSTEQYSQLKARFGKGAEAAPNSSNESVAEAGEGGKKARAKKRRKRGSSSNSTQIEL